MNEALAKDQLVPSCAGTVAVDADSLGVRNRISKGSARPAKPIPCARRWPCNRSLVDQANGAAPVTQQQRDELKVRAGSDRACCSCAGRSRPAGGAGHELARVGEPSAEGGDQVAETQAQDIQLGQEGRGRYAQRHRRRPRRPHRSSSRRYAARRRDADRRSAEGRGGPT